MESPCEQRSRLTGVYLEEEPPATHFQMEEPRPASRFLGMELTLYPAVGTTRKATIGQNDYSKYIIAKFKKEAGLDKL